MSLTGTFNGAPSPLSDNRPSAKAERPAPFSIRLTENERARLTVEAKGLPLGAYIKAKALGTSPLSLRRAGISIEDRQALGQALALLGRSHIANNLNQLAHAANIGTLPMTPETEEDLRETIRAVRSLRTLLLQALGMRGTSP
jgi:nitroreductase